MMQLLKLEGLKLLPYRTFWIFTGLYTALFVLAVYILGAVARSITVNGQHIELHLFEFPEIWHRVAYIGSFFHYLLAFLVILAITNEFDFHTFRLQLMDGLSRHALVAGKVLLILLLSLGASLLLTFICLLMGLLLAPSHHGGIRFENSVWVIVFWLQSVAVLSVAAFFAFLIRRPAPAIGAFLLYGLLGEFIVGWLLDRQFAEASAYLPMTNIRQLIANPLADVLGQFGVEPSLRANFFIVLIYLVIFWCAVLLIVEKRDF
jgi:ABC-type transport system involved in multi-copper enzyme maturation permease subunit